jgi:2-keto-4-pentenoate hydratase/2-oxohepta-3-ene-1,7-dioic acid hydratase in catechol pathway
MRLITFSLEGQTRLGAQVMRDGRGFVMDLNRMQPALPSEINAFLAAGEPAQMLAREGLAAARADDLLAETGVRMLAPVPRPGKIICLGHNYDDHMGRGRTEPPEYPTVFCKTGNTIIGSDAPIVIPPVTAQADFEAELAVVIGRRTRRVPQRNAMASVAGYTIFNDVSARDYQKRTSQWMIGKSFDTFGPMGPALVTADEIPDPHNLDLALTLNGVQRQRTNTRHLIFSIPFLIAYLSAVMTLEPGDVIATGTPAHTEAAPGESAFLKPGDVIRIEIEKIGELTNPVVAEGDASTGNMEGE